MLKNLDNFHDWSVKYRHWHIEIAESDRHEIWIGTDGLRHIYPAFPGDARLKAQFQSAMFYVRSVRRHYLSERAMRQLLQRASTGAHRTEILKFLDWFDRHVASVAAKKRERANLDRRNQIREEHAEVVRLGPLPRVLQSPAMEASTLALTPGERWAQASEVGGSQRVFHIDALPLRPSWSSWARDTAKDAVGLIISVWRGERHVVLAAVVSLTLLFVFHQTLGYLNELDLDPTRSFSTILWRSMAVMLLAVMVSAWMAVSLTRSAWRAFSEPGGKLWASTIWLLCVPMAPVTLIGEYDRDTVMEWWDMLTGRYQPATVFADRALRRVVISGEFKFGSAQALEAVLAANPSFKLVEIRSPGGYVLEGMRMAQVLLDRKMDTVALEACASACTLLLAAGEERYIGPKAEVGFHRSGSKYLPVSLGWSHTDHQVARYYASRGTTEEFIRRALTPPIYDLWVAPHGEMFASGFATKPWAERKSGY